MGLRARAVRQYVQERREDEERKRDHLWKVAQRAAGQIERTFGVPPDRLAVCHEEGWVELACEGLRFRTQEDGGFLTFHLLGTCPRCGQEVPSQAVGDLYGLGRILVHFQPDYGHRCPKPGGALEEVPSPSPTARDLLPAALAFVQAMSEALGHNGHPPQEEERCV
jgi:hypothetical protein